MKNTRSGFTLIELGVMAAIICVLVAIFISHFAAYRIKRDHALVESNCRDAAIAIEAYYIKNYSYAGASNTNIPGFEQAKFVDVAIVATDTDYNISCTMLGGSDAYTCKGKSDSPDGQPSMICR